MTWLKLQMAQKEVFAPNAKIRSGQEEKTDQHIHGLDIDINKTGEGSTAG